jgi:hypothetical protein
MARKKKAAEQPVPSCGIGTGPDGLKCAVVSWLMPLVATAVVAVGFYYPVVKVFNIVIVAFGAMALTRSLLHISRYGACGLGGHIVAGAILNTVLFILLAIYFFTSFDPLAIRH